MTKEEFENSFSGYHKDAPSHLKSQAAALRKNVDRKLFNQQQSAMNKGDNKTYNDLTVKRGQNGLK